VVVYFAGLKLDTGEAWGSFREK